MWIYLGAGWGPPNELRAQRVKTNQQQLPPSLRSLSGLLVHFPNPAPGIFPRPSTPALVLTHKHAWGTPARGPADEQDVGGAGHRSSESCAAQNQGMAYFQVGSGGLLHEVSLMRVRKGVWEPQASASGRVYQLTEASVLIASFSSSCPAPQGHHQVSDADPKPQSSCFCFFYCKKKKKSFLQWPKPCHLH